MKIQEIMTRDVKSCHPEDSLAEAVRVMRDRDCGCVPVVDGNNQVAGVITDRDICMAAYTQEKPLLGIAVSTVMSKEVFCCRPHEELEAAEQVMQQNQVRRLPIVDKHDHVVGLLSLNDLAKRTRLPTAQAGVSPSEVLITLAAICGPRVRPQARRAG